MPLIQCSFPHADPGELATFTRRNGWLELTLSTARHDTGLPYVAPARLLTIYCASEAIRTRSPEIYLGRTVHEFLRRLDVPITRGERGSLRVRQSTAAPHALRDLN
jgi:Plasmid encoded RepA protein